MRRHRDIPRLLWIDETLWRVEFARKPLQHYDGESCVGLCDTETNTIHLSMKLGAEERLATFIHELIHAVEDEYGFVVDHRVVDRLAKAFARLLLDNA